MLCPLWTGERYANDRIKVAYLSADFRNHPVSYLLAGVLERMEERGLISRQRDVQDKRAVRIWLTEEGRRLYGVLPPIAKSVLDTVCGGMTADDVAFLDTMVEKVIDNLASL